MTVVSIFMHLPVCKLFGKPVLCDLSKRNFILYASGDPRIVSNKVVFNSSSTHSTRGTMQLITSKIIILYFGRVVDSDDSFAQFKF